MTSTQETAKHGECKQRLSPPSISLSCLRIRRIDCACLPPDLYLYPGRQGPERPNHLRKVKAVDQQDLAEGWCHIQFPNALDRKYPNAPKDWCWQWLFPQEHRWKNTQTVEEGRHHVHETMLQREVKEAVQRAGVVKHAGCPTLRHSLATHFLETTTISEGFRNSWGTWT